jgi:hypothetical protein
MANNILGYGLLEIPSAGPVPTPAQWIGPQTITGTLASTITVTAMASTAGLAVGQPVSGTGIASGTTIASIVSSSSITLSIAATASGANALTFAAFLPLQSAFSGASAFFPQPPVGSETTDCIVETPNVQTIAAGASYVLPPFTGMVQVVTGGSGTIAQYQVQQGTAGTWVTLETTAPAQTILKGGLMGDGTNFRYASSGGVSTITIYEYV